MSHRHLTLDEISAYLDGELDLEASPRAHLKECAECARVYAAHQRLRRTARHASPAVPTEAMWREIRARLDAGRRNRPAPAGLGDLLSRRWVLPGLGGALAAAAVLVVVLWTGQSGWRTRPAPRPAARPAAPPERQAKPRAPEPASRPTIAQPERAKTADVPAAEESAPSAATPAPASRPAPLRREEKQRAPTRTAKKAPAAASPAPSAAPATEAPVATATAAQPEAPATLEAAERGPAAGGRRTYRTRRFVLTADAVTAETEGRVVARGRVRVEPVVPGGSYVVVLDGISLTVTGRLEGDVAVVVHPGEQLTLRRAPAAAAERAEPAAKPVP